MKDKKDRYVYKFIDGYGFFIDTETNIKYFINKFLVCLLNDQDIRIKELGKKYQDLKEDNDATTESLYASRTYLDKNTSKMWELEKENQQLKEEIKQLKFDCAMFKSANYLINDVGIDKAREIMFQSERQLKQTKKQFAIRELRNVQSQIMNDRLQLSNYLVNRIKELGDGKNEN